MPRTPRPHDERLKLEELLKSLPGRDSSLPPTLPDGSVLHYDPRLLLRDDGSLGPIARLMLMRCVLNDSAKTIKDKYKAACEKQGLPTTRHSALQFAFTLYTRQIESLQSLPPLATLSRGMCAVLDDWRERSGNQGLGLPPHPEPGLLFEKPFAGEQACQRFLDYLEYAHSPATQLASGRRLSRSTDREQTLGRVINHVVHGDSMLVNVYAEDQWDGLRAFSETLARELEEKEAQRARALNCPPEHFQRDVLFVPLRANALPGRPEHNGGADAHLPYVDEHMGLDRLMGLLLEFVRKGSAADLHNAAAMSDDQGFAKTLRYIREQLMSTARIIVFDGVYEPETELSRRTVERVMADDHFLFLLKRLTEPLLTATKEPQALDIFHRNRFVITSNSDVIAEVLWSPARDVNGKPTRTPPVNEPLRRTDAQGYDRMLVNSVRYPELVTQLLRRPSFAHCRNDAVNQSLDAVVGLLTSLFSGDAHTATDYYADFLRLPDRGTATPETVIEPLFGCLRRHAKDRSADGNADAADELDRARLWSELLLLLSIAPEGLTLETIERVLMRLSMTSTSETSETSGTSENISLPLPALEQARSNGTLDHHIIECSELASSVMGFIRREFVEGPEVEDHPLESWEGLVQGSALRDDPRYRGKTLDFRYPEVRLAVQRSQYWQTLQIDRCFLHRVISEIALQYQANFFRHTAYRHRGTVRYWRRLITALYHGLASIGRPDLATHIDYGVRGADGRGSSRDYWLFLYAKLYRQIMEQPKLWRVSRIMGLNDLQSALLELFSKPWILLDYRDTPDLKLPRFLEHFPDRAQPAAEYYLARMRGALSRGEVDSVDPGWSSRFSKIPRTPDIDNRLMMGYALLDLKVQTVEQVQPMQVIDELQKMIGIDKEFAELEELAHDPVTGKGLADSLPSVGYRRHERLPGLMSLVPQEAVDRLTGTMLEKLGKPSTLIIALNYYGTLSRLESDRADFAEGYKKFKRLPDGLRQEMRRNLERNLDLTEPECRHLRRQALARLLLVESARIALFRLDPTGVGFTRSKAQGRTAIRLAVKLDDEFRKQLSQSSSVPSAYFRFARRMADSCTRMSWEYPRDQSYGLVMETAMLRSESDRIMANADFTEKDAELTLRLLNAARSTIGRAERKLTTPNLVSRAMLRLTLERYKLNRDLARLHERLNNEQKQYIFRQHAEHDLSMLRGFVHADNARPYWKLLVSLQRDLPRSLHQVPVSQAVAPH